MVRHRASHAQDILADLIDTIVGALRPPFQLSKLEGDAAFVYLAAPELDASLLQDTIEGAYFAFRRRLRDIKQASICECDACRLIPTLDLKFVAHCGPIAKQIMIIQTAPQGTPRLAVMMHEHTALCAQFARAFGNDRFEALSPLELMIYVVGHHDAGWAEFDRDPAVDAKTGLPYNLVETPAEYITVTSRLSPDFNERQHPYCGLISSMRFSMPGPPFGILLKSLRPSSFCSLRQNGQ